MNVVPMFQSLMVEGVPNNRDKCFVGVPVITG